MDMSAPGAALGLDFGTTNSVIALGEAGGAPELIPFAAPAETSAVFRSALCFWHDDAVRGGLAVEAGPWAIAEYLAYPQDSRFIQSFKSVAAMATFEHANVFEKRFRFEELGRLFLDRLVGHAGGRLDDRPKRIVVGRPVEYAGSRPDPVLAHQRYEAMFGGFGTEVHYVYEPMGAAFSYAARLTEPATILVADFGGGTSDFSVMRFTRAGGVLRAEPLSHTGIGIAGDTFDYRIVDHIVSPRLGKGTNYRSFDKVLPIPNSHYTNLARWHQLALMKSNGDLRELRELSRTALKPALLEDFITIVDHDLGFSLYRAVSDAKVALSAQDEVDFRFKGGGVDIGSTITRKNFEAWIADDVARLSATVDKVLGEAGITAREVEKVFLTGGTSFVPAVRKLFAERFGNERLMSGDQFESIAYGLALIGHSPEPDRWTADGGLKSRA